MKQSLLIIIIFSLICGLAASGFSADSHKHSAGTLPAAKQSGDHDEHNGPPEHGHEADEHGHDHDEAEAGVNLSPAQQQNAGIIIEVLEARPLATEIYAPGELKANDYTSYLVSPRTDSIVLKRHVALGDHVEKDQPLVTLFANAVAETQAQYLIVRKEWQRVRQMGRKTVGAKRYIRAEMDFKTVYSRLKIFGLNEAAIRKTAAGSSTLGEYTLNATINGTVLKDDFQQGQHVVAGEALLQLVDERNLRVEAYLTPSLKPGLTAGSKARVKVAGRFYPAIVSQQEHTIDRQSRTRTVRLLVENSDHKLHPGMFVDVYFSIPGAEAVSAVPETALMRGADGDWTVFVEEKNGQYQAHEVERGRTFGDLQEINGITAGSRIVIEGAFFIASQLAKGGFDPHNH